ncbi:hypothetical protein [Pseudomonas abietaniphila]|uniref:hypothetical protein n=1 Tax=Pseudomonas abietaniphila TaxID=89065 RepID=UPI0007829C62|nr:hypothetical protein [Pseudomonas abietaniphila]
MRDTSLVLLVLILLNMSLDYGYAQWQARRPGPGRVRGMLVAFAQGAMVGAVLYAFDRHALIATAAGATFALCWGVIRWQVGRWQSGFAFVLRFALQVVAITAVWLSAEGYWGWAGNVAKDVLSTHNLLVVLAYALVLRPASALIGAVLTPWLASVSSEGSLKSAGKLIGYLERVLILTFVLLQQWEGIGFLLTAKSILRFNDLKSAEQRSLSEYVLLGTLVSFTVSMAIGLAVLKLSGK